MGREEVLAEDVHTLHVEGIGHRHDDVAVPLSQGNHEEPGGEGPRDGLVNEFHVQLEGIDLDRGESRLLGEGTRDDHVAHHAIWIGAVRDVETDQEADGVELLLRARLGGAIPPHGHQLVLLLLADVPFPDEEGGQVLKW